MTQVAPGAFTISNPVALWTLIKREMKRTWVVINQVIWPPIITTVLYVFVFGLALGSRIGNTQGVSYAAFLIPGLIMLQVIDAAYGEAGSSVFQGRFLNHIQELLAIRANIIKRRNAVSEDAQLSLPLDRAA